MRIFSRDELKQDDMRRSLSDPRVRFYIGDVRDYDSVHRATRGVDYVFHAAALKQVPSCEFFPLEAVRTNVLGSANVIEASNANGVGSVVCLGTDKAAYPVNAMGMSKAMMEKVAQAFARNNPTARPLCPPSATATCSCREDRSIPLFVEQIKAGQPLTVTDPEMTRFLMSLDEAVLLVEHAFAHARPGDLFIRKAPACTVGVLARAVSTLLDAELEIDVIGTRHGEKLYETLATREELARAEDQDDYFRVAVDARDLNYGHYFEQGDPSRGRGRRLPLAQHRTARARRGGRVASAPALHAAGAGRPMTRHVVLVHRYFAPDTPPYASILATSRSASGSDGFRVTVLTCQPSYNRAVVSRHLPASSSASGSRWCGGGCSTTAPVASRRFSICCGSARGYWARRAGSVRST